MVKAVWSSVDRFRYIFIEKSSSGTAKEQQLNKTLDTFLLQLSRYLFLFLFYFTFTSFPTFMVFKLLFKQK